MQSQSAEAIADTASRLSVSGAVIGGAGWLSLNEILAIGGFLLAAIGLCVNWYFRIKADKRETEKHIADMARRYDHRSYHVPTDEE